MPKTPIVHGFMPVPLLSACSGGQRPANICLNESHPAPCPALPNREMAQTRSQTRRTRKIQARAASRFSYAGFAANQAQGVAILDRFAALAGAPS